MLGLALQVLGNRRDAEDLLHDVFLEVWRKSARYDPDRASARTWLLVMVRSRAIDRLRTLARRPRSAARTTTWRGAGSHVEPEGLRRLDRDRVLDAIGALPAAQREIVSLAVSRA